jgi:hypothetical protein
MTLPIATDPSVAPDAERSRAAAASNAERALAHVFALLERLADVLAAPADADGGATAFEFESAVCGCIAHLRATGARRDQVAARLVRLVQAASAHHRPQHETATRVAAVVAWCERADHAPDGARPA